MASSFVKSLIQNPLDDTNLRDYSHANKIFATNAFRLAPKSKFNFHVLFRINNMAADFKDQHLTELSVLVKSFEMPKFKVDTQVMHQYNRKRVVQVKHEYQPLRIELHDDNYGVVRKLWEKYYKYYYGDPSMADQHIKNGGGPYLNSAYEKFNSSYTYGLDNGSRDPFFNSITLYHMGVFVDGNDAYHGSNSYTLINPLITEWSHDTLDYSAGNELSTHTLTIQYESVSYDPPDNTFAEKNVKIPTFGDPDFYDTRHSPLIKK